MLQLQKLAKKYVASEPQKSVQYYHEALQTARIINNKNSEAHILQELGILEINRLGNYKDALEHFVASVEILQKMQDKGNLANALCNVAIAYELLSDFDNAILYNKNALQTAENISHKGAMALAENNLGNIYSRTANYDDALKSYLNAYRLKEEIGDDSSIILNNIGIIYERLEKYQEALTYHQEALTSKRNNGASPKSVATSLTNIANVNHKLGNNDKANQFHQEALTIRQSINDTEGIALSLQNIGVICFEEGKYEQALNQFTEALKRNQQLGNLPGIISALIETGRVYFVQNRWENAEKAWLEAEEYAKKIQANESLITIYDKLNELYKEKNDYEKALFFNEKMMSVKDKISSVEKTKSIIEMTTKFETKQKEEKIVNLEKTKDVLSKEKELKEKQLQVVQKQSVEQEKQIDVLEKEKEILEKEKEINELQIKNTQLELMNKELALTRITNQRMYFGIVLLLSVLLAITFYNQYRSKKRDVESLEIANTQIQKQNKKLEELYLKESKLVKELEELNATKNKFFSIIAHDLKNGFSSLLSGSKLLTTHIQNMEKEAIQEIAEELKNSTDTLFNLLQNLLQWSRIQTGRIEHNPEEIPLYMLIHYNLRILRTAAESKQIQLGAEVDENSVIWADKNMLNSVIQNVIYNALKFTKSGGEINIKTLQKEDKMQICVIDNGVGMTEKTKQKLFRIDEHVTHRGTNNEQGTGLGLLLCKEFIEKNNGKIWIESEEGKGTSVCFLLPKSDSRSNV
jgi:signal transduction histidine kinase/tetratricopeptide (TPR) repeat protein